jgi:hypothetical protein
MTISDLTFTPDPEYASLLMKNSGFHIRVRHGKASYSSDEYRSMQKRLLEIELSLTSEEIIKHAEYLFPKVAHEQ